MPITTNRNAFIGGHVTSEEKEIVRKEARRDGGISKWLHRLIRRELIAKGYDLKQETK